jgi:cell division protein FtsI (penicillin-binding protein 3)
VVRRVVSQAVARRVRDMLLGVVEAGGTAKRADLGSFSLAGKTGTARRTVHGSYVAGDHIPTFVGLFPADNPQFVILVKIDNPKGDYMGGLTAAPVTKRVLEAALASRDASLNRRSLAASRHERAPDSTAHPIELSIARPGDTTAAARTDTPTVAIDDTIAPRTFVATLPLHGKQKPVVVPPKAVPDVHGFTLRQAVHALHAAGFRVELDLKGNGDTQPAAGSMLPVGTLVHLSATP